MEENSSSKKPKRKNGSGMVRRRKDGSWEARFLMGEGEERKLVSRYAKSEEEAEARLSEMQKTDRINRIERERAEKKRKNGSGTVRLHNYGTWECRLTVRQAGGMRPLSRYAQTEEEARAKLEELKAIVKEDPDYFLKYKKSRGSRVKPGSPRSLYFVQAGEGGPIKIGLARDIERRVAVMQTCNYLPLKVLVCVARVTHQAEVALHKKFYYCRLRGEWFWPHPDLLAFIKQLSDSPELVSTIAKPRRAS